MERGWSDVTGASPHMFLERADGLLVDDGWGWVGVTVFRSDAAREGSAAMFERWKADEASGLYAGTLNDVGRHGPLESLTFGLELFERVSPGVALDAIRTWVEGAWRADTEQRDHERSRVSDLVEPSLAKLDPDEVYLVARTAEQCAEANAPFPGTLTGFVEVFGLLADGSGCLVITATDDA